MAEHEVAPLDPREAQLLRSIAQELTRTDPRLLREPAPAGPGARPSGAVIGSYLLVSCALIGATSILFGSPAAVVTGVVTLVVGVAAWAATGRLPHEEHR